ncbi:hypothetical protein ACSBR1_003705 [Camellia fascicularis]
MSHAMVVSLCFPTVRSAANPPKQRADTKKALTRNETGAAAEQQWVWRREEGCSVVVCGAAYTLPLVDLEFPKVGVQFQDLCVDVFVLVRSKALSTIPNFIFNMTEVQGSSEVGSQYSSAMAPQGLYDMQWTRVQRQALNGHQNSMNSKLYFVM